MELWRNGSMVRVVVVEARLELVGYDMIVGIKLY